MTDKYIKSECDESCTSITRVPNTETLVMLVPAHFFIRPNTVMKNEVKIL